MDISLILALASALLVSWMIGANSASTAFGPVAGTSVGGVLRGALFAGIFGLIGAVVQGDNVASTVGNELINGITITPISGSIILLTAALLVIVSVFARIPTPISFTVVGGTIGIGLGLSAGLNLPRIQVILITWVAIPFVAVALGYSFSKGLRYFTDRNDSERLLQALLLTMGAFCAYTAGANLAGLAIGPVMNNVDVSIKLLLLAGGTLILLGAWLGGPRIVSAVSTDYSEMGIRRSICALATAAVIAQSATILGIPVSFNEAIIASIIGSGLSVGVSGIQIGKIVKTGVSWVGVFFLAMGITWAISFSFLA